MTGFSKIKFQKILDQNVNRCGFVKETFGVFSNYYLDSLVSGSSKPHLLLRQSANLSREDVAKVLGISAHTIRRYESEDKAPRWYYIMLRMFNGDLSFYGNRWRDCNIQYHDRKLKNPYSLIALEPFQMNQAYNRISLDARKEAREERIKVNEMSLRVEALEKINAELLVKNQVLENRIKEDQLKQSLVESGKVVQMFQVNEFR